MRITITLFTFLFCSVMLVAQSNIWSDSSSSFAASETKERLHVPNNYRTVAFNADNFLTAVQNTPSRTVDVAAQRTANNTVQFPMPDGGLQSFYLVDAELMHPDLAAKFPELKSYIGKGIDDPTADLRITYSPHLGFSGMIRSGNHSNIYIDPLTTDNANYMVYYRNEVDKIDTGFTCLTPEPDISIGSRVSGNSQLLPLGDCDLRRYRLALSCNGEYAQYHITQAGGTTGNTANDKMIVQAAMNVTMARVNGVYEKDLGITLQVIANNDDIIYLNAATDPWNGEYNTTTAQTIDAVIGVNNYDIGHNFNTSGGGSAGCLDCVCLSANQGGTHKGRGYTGLPNPIGDPFDIDYVAHEMGHQFGGYHVQSNQSCRSGSGATEVEPGSGSSIMGYAGICNANVQNQSDDYFAYVNIRDIVTSINGGNGSGCAEVIASGNAGPTANAGADYTIPISTPFKLQGTGSDPNDVGLTYNWEQNDPENPGSNAAPPTTRTQGPMFRSLDPVAVDYRYMPNLADLLNNVTPTWEVLPSVSRNMEFSFIVRDNNMDSGCTDSDLMSVSTTNSSGPFVVTSPNTSGIIWPAGGIETITWDVAGTNNAPVSCANVDILMSTDGGLTYPITLASNVTNDGSQDITVPNNPGTMVRIMVVCSDNIFFDISNFDLEIEITGPDFTVSANPNTVTACQPNDGNYTVNIVGLGGFTGNVTLSALGVPAGSTATFGTNPISGTGTSTLTLTSAGVTPGTYTITIQANGSTGIKTTTVDFIVLAGAPAVVTLNSPANGTTGVSTTAPLAWAVATGAISYDVEVATDATFSSIVYTQSGITGITASATGLTINTVYYWRVRAVNPCGMSAWSTFWEFTTQDIAACSQYTTGPYTDFNPIPSACYNNCTPVSQTFQVYQNESYIFYSMTEGEEYTFDFCNGYSSSTWEAQISVAEYDINAGAVVPGSEFATIIGCSLTFTVPSSGNYVLVISDPNNCGGATVQTNNGIPTLSCSGLSTCCGAIFTDPAGPVANYANAANSVTTFCPDFPGQMIEVTFTQFSLEANGAGCWDYLNIYNGNSTGATQIGGQTCDAQGSPGTVTSTSPDGCLTFEFLSDNSVNQAGWIADVACIGGPVTLAPKVFLQGPLSGTTMNVALTGMLPTTSPYADAKPLGSAVPANTVDWIWVEVRDDNTATPGTVYGQSGLVLDNGEVVDVDGAPLQFPNVTAGTDWYVLIQHRNHLGMMTANKVTLNN